MPRQRAKVRNRNDPETLVRLPLAPLLMTLLTLAACSEELPLSVENKAKFTAELIADRSECATYRQRLAAPTADRELIAQTYQAAKRAHCLKPDI